MTTEIKPSKSAVRRFKRKRVINDRTDIMVYNLGDGLWYYQKIHHRNLVAGWSMTQMETVVAHGHWEEITRGPREDC